MGYKADETKLKGEFYLNIDTWDTLCRELFSLLLFTSMPESPSVGSITTQRCESDWLNEEK